MDRIILDSLPVRVRIGTRPEEQTAKQELVLHAELAVDLREAGLADDLTRSVDYSQVEARLAELAENSSFQLLEALAEHLCRVILTEHERVCSIRLRIDKPGAARLAGCIAVAVERDRSCLKKQEGQDAHGNSRGL